MKISENFALCILLALLGGVSCASGVQRKLKLLEKNLKNHIKKFEHYQEKVDLDKDDLITNQEQQILDLETRLDNNMEEKVTQALDKILSSGVYRDIIRAKVDEEVVHLRNALALVKTQLHRLSKKNKDLDSLLGVLQGQNREFRKALEKEPRCQCKAGEESKPTQTSNHSSVSATTTTSYPVTSTVFSNTTRLPRLTTPAPEERNNLFIVPILQPSKHHHPRLVNIHSNAISVYPHLNLKRINTVVYISKLNSLFFGLYNPNKIISSKLNSSSVKTIKDNVWTYGMAVDDKISTVFMTTREPTWTISRMRLDGGEYTTVVSLSGYRWSPRTIAVDTNTKIIYTCNYYDLLSVKYDGSGLTTLDTGDKIRAVTLDIINGVLYYGNYNNLMQRSLSNTTSTEVTELPEYMWNLVYYRDVVYYMSYYGTLGSVDVGQNNEVNTSIMQTKPVLGVDYYSICLIP